MFKKINTLTALIVALTVGAAVAETDGQIYYAEDAAPAIRIKADTEDVVITIYSGGAATSNTVVIGSTTTTIDGSGASVDTIAELAAAIAAATNSASKTPLKVDTSCVVATTESTDGELLDGSVTIKRGTWGHIKWDTSDVKHFRVYVPSKENGASRRAAVVKSLYGNVGGTGDITITGYVGGSEAYQAIFESPYTTGSNTGLSNEVVAGIIDIPVDLYAGQDQAVLFSCDRATTGTTGGVGVRLEYK